MKPTKLANFESFKANGDIQSTIYLSTNPYTIWEAGFYLLVSQKRADRSAGLHQREQCNINNSNRQCFGGRALQSINRCLDGRAEKEDAWTFIIKKDNKTSLSVPPPLLLLATATPKIAFLIGRSIEVATKDSGIQQQQQMRLNKWMSNLSGCFFHPRSLINRDGVLTKE